jgi:hypothetical protein
MWKLLEFYEAGVEVNLQVGYSPQLKEFIEWCLMVDPVRRMKPKDTARSWAANFKGDECQKALTEWAQKTEGRHREPEYVGFNEVLMQNPFQR